MIHTTFFTLFRIRDLSGDYLTIESICSGTNRIRAI